MVDIVERINVLLQQERLWYLVAPKRTKEKIRDEQIADNVLEAGEVRSTSTSTSSGNEIWRERICEWSFQVIDHFDFSREVVSIAMNYLDRYLSECMVDKLRFQLLGMSCLFLAIKLYEPAPLSMKAMVEWSRGYFTVEEMEEMEKKILL